MGVYRVFFRFHALFQGVLACQLDLLQNAEAGKEEQHAALQRSVGDPVDRQAHLGKVREIEKFAR